MCQSLFLEKFIKKEQENFIKKEALTQKFSCELREICKNTFLQNTSGWLPLNDYELRTTEKKIYEYFVEHFGLIMWNYSVTQRWCIWRKRIFISSQSSTNYSRGIKFFLPQSVLRGPYNLFTICHHLPF